MPPGTIQWVRLPWKDSVRVDVTKTIGASIWTIGLYEITVSEILARLIAPGDVVVDAGANIGYMSILMGRCAGARGKLLSFEPHPALFPFLEDNVEAARRRGDFASVTLHKVALSEVRGEAVLSLPQDFGLNEGIARLVGGGSDGENAANGIKVPTETLDNVLTGVTVAVIKLDVEEHEAAVLRGTARMLREHRIRHIIYEDFQGPTSEAANLLRGHGYTIVRVGARFSGPVLAAAESGELHGIYEPPSFLATLEPELVQNRCQARGWKVLRSSLERRV